MTRLNAQPRPGSQEPWIRLPVSCAVPWRPRVEARRRRHKQQKQRPWLLVKPQAESTREQEPTEGDARVTRQLIDELKKETASMRRTYTEKVKRTRGCSFGLNDRPSSPGGESEKSEVSYPRPASTHRTKKNKSIGPADADSTSNPELHEIRRLVQSQAAQIKILQDQLHQSRVSPAREEESEGLELVTAEHHRAFMTFRGVDPQIDLQVNMNLQAYLKHMPQKWSLQWWKELAARKEIGVVPQEVTRKEIARALWHIFASTVRA